MLVAIVDRILVPTPFSAAAAAHQEGESPGQLDIWSSIQSSKQKESAACKHDEPYVHSLVRRSSSILSQKSLEICTETLGSETGSDDIFSSSGEPDLLSAERERTHQESNTERFLNYHCPTGSRRSSAPRRSFPPPLRSISCRDGPCLQMSPHRRDGRLVVKAVPVPARNYLHAERRGGRLILSFANTNSLRQAAEEQASEGVRENHEVTEAGLEDEEEEEEVEVVERRTVVEVKVSTQPQQNTKKVHRSSIVINKFVSGNEENYTVAPAPSPAWRLSSATTTAAAAAVAASSVGTTSVAEGGNKLLFISKRRNREELLHDMRRCSQLRRPLFIWEPCCIATSS